MKDNVKQFINCYKSDPRVKQFMNDRIKLNDLLKSKDRSRFSTEENNFDNKLRQDKKRLLDNVIFPSMANLIVFFEYLAKNPESRDLFEEDIKELFGYIIGPDFDKHKFSDINHNIIRRFLESVLTWDINKDPINFRLDLVNEIYKVFVNYLQYILSKEFGNLPKFVIDDLSRIEFWTRLHASSYVKSGNEEKDLHKQSKRPVQF
jgi:hypothetical protein